MGQGGWFNPDENVVRGQVEYAKEKVKKELPPDRKPGDKYTLFGATAGIIAGIIVGIRFRDPFWLPLACIIAGGLIGTVLGSVIGNLVTRWRGAKDKH
ncbi:MAG: hypothetical protein HYX80_05350 [Chloroflexi bacterium]|nr:hypothetical protein [Chloroflexota bacterium]